MQIKVNCSTRATSFGFERCKYERGAFFWFSLINTSCFNDSEIRKSFSALRAVAPKNILRLGQQLDFMHPIEHGLICWFVIADSGWRRNGGRRIVHKRRAIWDD